MQSSNQPDKISLPFANSGAKQTIPVASQIGIEDARASYTDGFPPLTRIPLSAGGKPPFGTDMNGIFNAITDIQRWQSAGGLFKFDASFAAAIGGYPKGAVLAKADASGVWRNLADDNVTNPDTGGANWIGVSPGGLLNVQTFTVGGTYTPTPGTTSIIVDQAGGGGGGGGVPATGVGQISAGGGGGGGARCVTRLTSGFSGAAIIIGPGGAGGTSAGTSGANGGTTTFGSIVAAGGQGGNGGPSASIPPFGQVGGGGGSAPSGGLLNIAGAQGGIASAFSTTSFISGGGGASPFGGGGANGIGTSTSPGNNAPNKASGGGGACNGASTAGQAGGAGGAGIVIVYEYA